MDLVLWNKSLQDYNLFRGYCTLKQKNADCQRCLCIAIKMKIGHYLAVAFDFWIRLNTSNSYSAVSLLSTEIRKFNS